MNGPLEGVNVVELAVGGPACFAAMLLADLGCRVFRLDRPADQGGMAPDVAANPLFRSRESIGVDLTSPESAGVVHRLIGGAHVVLNGLRDSLTQRLSIDPESMLARHPSLVYASVSAWGKAGPYASLPGHAINAEALSGVLSMLTAPTGAPQPPLNLLGSFASGALLASGVIASIYRAKTTGVGDILDHSIVDGVATLAGYFIDPRSAAGVVDDRRRNMLDGSAPFYTTYRCMDGKFMAAGCIEERPWRQMLSKLGLEPDPAVNRMEPASWPSLRTLIATRFLEAPRQHWVEIFADGDAAVTPVLDISEAMADPHNQHREVFTRVEDAVYVTGPTRMALAGSGSTFETLPCRDTRSVLEFLGYNESEIAGLISRGVVFQV